MMCVSSYICVQRKRTVEPGLRVCTYHMIILRYLDEFFFYIDRFKYKIVKGTRNTGYNVTVHILYY